MTNPIGRVMVAVVGIAVLTSAAIFGVQAVRTAAYDQECRSNLAYIGLAISNYADNHQRFPSPQADGHSWRIRIVPYLFASSLYNSYRFNEPWNGENNRTLDIRPLTTKGGPSRPHGMPNPYTDLPDSPSEHATRFLMFVGEHAFGLPDGYRRVAEIQDDPQTVLVAAETRLDDVHWLQPFDFPADDIEAMRRLLGDRRAQAPLVLFADGSVYRMSLDIPHELLQAMITIDGSERIDRAKLIRAGYLR